MMTVKLIKKGKFGCDCGPKEQQLASLPYILYLPYTQNVLGSSPRGTIQLMALPVAACVPVVGTNIGLENENKAK